MASTATEFSITVEYLATLSAIEQLDYVFGYMLNRYVNRGPLRNLGDVYLAAFVPRGIGQNDEYVLFTEGQDAYRDNRGLDLNWGGVITRGEAIQAVLNRRAYFERGTDKKKG